MTSLESEEVLYRDEFYIKHGCYVMLDVNADPELVVISSVWGGWKIVPRKDIVYIKDLSPVEHLIYGIDDLKNS